MIEAWAESLAVGVPDAVFWDSTPAETLLLISKLRERLEAERKLTEYNANVRFGTIAAEVANASPYRRPGTFGKTWRSFFKDESDASRDTPNALKNALLAWAETTPGVKVSKA